MINEICQWIVIVIAMILFRGVFLEYHRLDNVVRELTILIDNLKARMRLLQK